METMANISDLENTSLLNSQDTKLDPLEDDSCSEHPVALEPDVDRIAHTNSRSRLLKRTFQLVVKAILLTLAFSGLVSISNHILLSLRPKPSASCSCGKSVAEAIARGCKLDPSAPAWLPEHCRDDDLIEEWNRSGPGPGGSWPYYTDRYGNVTLTLEELGRLADAPVPIFYMTQEWHIMHCVFYWRKLQIAYKTKGLTIEEKYDNDGHIMHCVGALKDRAPLDEVNTLARVVLDSAERLP